MTALVQWDNPHWGQPGHNVHVSAWAPDRHSDENDEETP